MNKWTRSVSVSLAGALAIMVIAGPVAAKAGNDPVLSNNMLYEVRTASGTGEFQLRDGETKEAAFREPSSLLYDEAKGSFLVADSLNQRLRLVTPEHTGTVAGLDIGYNDYNAPEGAFEDGPVDKAAFNSPTGLTEDMDGNVYIADSENNAVRKIDPYGRVTTIAGTGEIGLKDGAGEEALLHHPLDVAAANSGAVYIADTLNHVIRMVKDGNVTTIGAASGRLVEYVPGAVEPAGDFADGPLGLAKFNEPSGLALDEKGNLYVSDTGNQRIRYIDFTKGMVTTVAGGESGKAVAYTAGSPYAEGGYADGKAAAARFRAPRGLTVTPDGGVLIADSLNHVIRYLKDGKVTTVAGIAEEAGKSDGLAKAATFNKPVDVVWMGNGSFGVADSGSNKIRVVVPYTLPQGFKSGKTVQLLYNASLLHSDVPPLTLNNSIFVPARVLTERLGFKVQVAPDGKTMLTRGTLSYAVQTGSMTTVKKTGGEAEQTIKLAAAPFIKQNRLYLPVRFFAQEIGLDVQWLTNVRAVLIRDKQF